MYSLQFLEPLKAGCDILGSWFEVLQVCDPVALLWGVKIPDSKRSPDALGHFVQEGLHGGHLTLVDHKPTSAVEGVSIPEHHYVLDWRQVRWNCSAGCHL